MFLKKILIFYSSSTGIIYYFWNYDLWGNILLSSIVPIYALDEEFRQMPKNEKKELLTEVLDEYGLEISESDLNTILNFFFPNSPVDSKSTLPDISTLPTPEVSKPLIVLEPVPIKPKLKPTPPPKKPIEKNVGCQAKTYTFEDVRWVYKKGSMEVAENRTSQKYEIKYKKYKLDLEVYSQEGKCQTEGTPMVIGTEQDFEFEIEIGNELQANIWWYNNEGYPTQQDLINYLKNEIIS